MKRTVIVLTTSLICIFLISSCSIEKNRYDLVQSDDKYTMLIDKQEGTVWVLNSTGWLNLGTPPSSAPEPGDKYSIK